MLKIKVIERNPQLLLWVVLTFVMLIAAFLIIDSYTKQLELIRDRELARLEGITGTLASVIDAEAHRTLMMQHKEMYALCSNDQDSTYYTIHETLRQARKAHGLDAMVRTMVYEPRIDKFCILVTDSTIPNWKHPYRDYPSELLVNYEKGGRLDFYTDSKGTWLSAFHPIKTEDGTTVGIVLAEERFDHFIRESQQLALRNITISVSVTLIIVFILFLVLRNLLKTMERLRREKEDLENLRKELLANVSHDLRTPLASIQGYLETALNISDLDESKRNEYLSTALLSTEKLKGLIDELFDLSRLESRDRKPVLEPFSIAELASDVVAGLRITAENKGVTLEESIPTDLPAIEADIALMNRVLQNVVANAVKYTDSGGKVLVKLSLDESMIKVEVIDNGIGISADDLKTVFERFRTGQRSGRKGTGLGLAIVKSILDAHDARYSFTSQQGKGSHFTFWLKLA